jgi:spermidine/putrescine transport system permease protein
MRHLLLAAIALLLLVPPARADLDLFAWSEYVPKEVIAGYTKETGVAVNYQTYASNEEMVSKLLTKASNYDLIQPSEYTVETLIARHLLAPLDPAALPNLRNLDPAFMHLPFDPGQQYSVPYMAGTVGIVVNTATVHTPIKGFADVFTAAHKGRIVVVNDNREIVSWALAANGIDINDVTPATLARVRPQLAAWMPLVKVFDSDSPKTPLINGDCDLGVVWSGEAALCYQHDPKFQYVLPAEGAHQFVDNLCVPATAAHKAEAMAFINYCLRPEVSKLISDQFPYTNPNAAARKLLSQAQRDNPASYPPGANKLATFHAIGKGASQIEKLMAGVRNGG